MIMCLSEHLLTAGNISQHTPRIASAAFENTIYSNFLVWKKEELYKIEKKKYLKPDITYLYWCVE